MMLKLSFLFAIIHIVMSGTIDDTTHPNVIIMHVNNLSWNDLGIHVNRADNENSTPNIDRLAYAGIILNHFYANGGSDSLYSGCYQRSSYGNPNLMSTYFERNGYDVKLLASKNFTKPGSLFNAIVNSITNDNEPFLLSVDFGYLGYDIKIPYLDDIIGAIVTKLNERNILGNTIIIFMSLPTENGYETSPVSIESNIRRTAFIYSKLLLHQHSVSNQLIHISDILPTLVDAAQLQWRTKDRIFIDGVNQWKALSSNDNNVRTSIFGDNFYINNYWKLCYGTSKSELYDSINNQFMDGTGDENFDFGTYVESITSSDVHDVLGDDVSVKKIILMRNRAKVHCNMNDINDSIVINIKCSRAAPCLFDLQTDPCEFDDMHEEEFDLKRSRMVEAFEAYLDTGIVKDLSNTVDDNHQTGNHTDDDSHVIGDPILTPSGGVDAFLTLGVVLGAFLALLIITVCIKERCNSRRSVYFEKEPKKVTFKDESGMDVNAIPTVSANVPENKRNGH